MKGIILVAGKGTRLYPISSVVPKPLLPVYDKPMIYYSIYTMMSFGISDILIIVSNEGLPHFQKLLGDGSKWGIKLDYEIQQEALGIAHALILAETFIGNDNACLLLGDNIFYGDELKKVADKVSSFSYGALSLGLKVDDPRPFGVLSFDSNGQVVDIEEKPKEPRSEYIVPGMYFFDNKAIAFSKDLKPSKRGELEITDLLKEYVSLNELDVILLDNLQWFDAGNFDELLYASDFVKKEQERLGTLVFSPDMLAYERGLIDVNKFERLVHYHSKSFYGKYLLKVLREE